MTMYTWDSEQQREMLTQRLAMYAAADPRWTKLSDKLLALGGLALVAQGPKVPGDDMDRVLSGRAETFSGANTIFEPGLPNSCHATHARPLVMLALRPRLR